MRLTILSAMLIPFIAASGCLPLPHPSDPLVVYGEVLDNRTIRPLANAEVAIRFPKRFTARTDETDARGRFSVPSHGGWKYFVSMLPEDKVDEIRIRVKVEHPDFQEEEIDEFFPLEGNPPKVNLGAIYLEPK